MWYNVLMKQYWSFKHKLYACCLCGKSDIPHQANGYCKKCYERIRGRRRWEKIKSDPILHKKIKQYSAQKARERRANNPELRKREQKQCKKWYEKNKEYRKRYYKKYYQENKKYHNDRGRKYRLDIDGELYQQVCKRAKNKCEECGKANCKLDIHHIDGNGLGAKVKNNNLNNLQLLCVSCHMKIHNNKNVKRT